MKDMVAALKKFSLFSGLAEEELLRLSRIAFRQTYSKKSFVFMEGEPREAVFFIQSGSIKAYKMDENGNEQVISLLHAGDMFPHVGFFDTSPYPATAEVMQDAELIVIRIDDFEQLLLNNPQIALKVMRIMGQKILLLQQRLQEFISGDVHRRIILSLLRMADEYGKEHPDGILIDFPLTNQDFANLVGTSRESVNRTLNRLKKEGVLETHRHGILIYSLKALQEELSSP